MYSTAPWALDFTEKYYNFFIKKPSLKYITKELIDD
jgi:hypothetical protein